jgi:hypothetical protein
MAATTPLTINSGTFVSLGIAPAQVQCLGYGSVVIVVADSLPAVGTPGFVLSPLMGSTPVYPADGSSIVYVAALDPRFPAAIVYNPTVIG